MEMATKLLEGKLIANTIKGELKKEVAKLKGLYGVSPSLVAIQVGKSSASELFIKSQVKACESLAIEYTLQQLPESISQEDLIEFVSKLNQDEKVTGIIVQLPLPRHIDSKSIFCSLNPKKDVEGLHPENLGRIALGRPHLVPCTPQAVMELIDSTEIDLYGKEVVVVGHSEIVGKPLALLFLAKFSTVTICHIATSQKGNLANHVKKAEVLVVAVGKAGLIKGEWIKKGAIVIDVGINQLKDKIVGDVEFNSARKRAGFITPVPGGVGPLTVAMLMKNTVEAFKLQKKR
jgi:methylenetetrahydrofolate dehydrogenase (NADP+)/methenyltetrahydrofolate cyclohydrolase